MPNNSRRHSAVSLAFLCLLAVLLAVAPADARKRRGSRSESTDVPASRQHDVYYQEGLLFFRAGQLAQAREKFEDAVNLQPAFVEALYMLGVTYMQLSELDRAEKALRAALDANAFFTDAHLVLGIVYDKKGELDRAITEWQIVLSDKHFPQPWNATFNIGKAFADRDNWEEAVVYFQRAVGQNSEWFRAWYFLGLAQEELGNVSKAVESYERAIEEAPDEYDQLYMIRYRLALASYKQGQNVKALEYFREVWEARPDTGEGRKAKEFVQLLEGGHSANSGGLPPSIYR